MKSYKGNTTEFTLKYNKSEFKKVKIGSSENINEFARQFWNDDINIYESFFITLLNRSNNTLGYVKISQGGTAGTVVDLKLIAKYAIESLSSSVILCHNHPSGNLKPSQADIDMTKKIKNGLKIFDIQVLDHLILTDEKYYSFADEGLM